LILMLFRMLNMPKEQRNQVYLFVSAIMVIIIPNLFHILRHNPIYPYDPTPLSISIVGVLFLVSLYRHKLLGVLPVAHAQVFKNMRSAVIVIDSNDIVQEVNPAAKSIFNVTNKDVAGRPVGEMLPECINILSEYKSKSEVGVEINIDQVGATFELKINALTDTKGRHTGRLMIFFDISDRVKAVNELDAYARTVAHDLKNPLNAILGHAHLLTEACEAQDDPDLCLSLDGIKAGAMHMNDIVESLLLLASVRNVESVNSETINMKGLLQSTLNRLESNINKKKAIIKIADNLPKAKGVDLWIEEVWANLISNAIKYGGDSPEIEISAVEQGNMVFYYIKDHGIGLSGEQQDEVFSEFTRMHQHKSEIAGHGLGLSIVKRVVEKLGGEVGVDSTPGEGSVFSFSLPTE